MSAPPPSDADPDRCTVLVVDEEPIAREVLSRFLASDYSVTLVESAEAAMAALATGPCDVLLVSSQDLPGMKGTELLEWARLHHPDVVRLFTSAYYEAVMEALVSGLADHYSPKPFKFDDLRRVLHNATERFRMERFRKELRDHLHRLHQERDRLVAARTRELEEANQSLERRVRELERLAPVDPLTSLLNRPAINGVAEAEVRRHALYGRPLSLGFIDVDHFKEVNRRFLLPGGDAALIQLARTLTRSVREVDSVGRFGGDRFLVVAPEAGRDEARILGERLCAAVEQAGAVHKDEQIALTVSIGFAVAEGGAGAGYDRMKEVGDQALDEAKWAGRNRCVVLPVG
jgi:diguanylate cyclase (GGDEF)-like protein